MALSLRTRPARSRRGLFSLRRLVLSLLLLGAAGGMYLAFTESVDQEPEQLTVRDAAVEQVFPPPGDLELRQTRIGVDLVDGYRGVLQIDGVEIPEDQYEAASGTGNVAVATAGLNQVVFVPGAGKEIERLSPGRHCVTAVFWPQQSSRDAARRLPWCFEVH